MNDNEKIFKLAIRNKFKTDNFDYRGYISSYIGDSIPYIIIFILKENDMYIDKEWYINKDLYKKISRDYTLTKLIEEDVNNKN